MTLYQTSASPFPLPTTVKGVTTPNGNLQRWIMMSESLRMNEPLLRRELDLASNLGPQTTQQPSEYTTGV